MMSVSKETYLTDIQFIDGHLPHNMSHWLWCDPHCCCRTLLWRRWCNKSGWWWDSFPNPRSFVTATLPCASYDRRRQRSSYRRRKRRRRPRSPSQRTTRTKRMESWQRRCVTEVAGGTPVQCIFGLDVHNFRGWQPSTGGQNWSLNTWKRLMFRMIRPVRWSLIFSFVKTFFTWRCIKYDHKRWDCLVSWNFLIFPVLSASSSEQWRLRIPSSLPLCRKYLCSKVNDPHFSSSCWFIIRGKVSVFLYFFNLIFYISLCFLCPLESGYVICCFYSRGKVSHLACCPQHGPCWQQ